MKDIAKERENEELSAFMKAAVENVVRFAVQPGPIVIAVGDRPKAEVGAFVAAVVMRMPDAVNHIRNMTRGIDVTRYLDDDTHPDPIFYRDILGDPSVTVQRLLAKRCADPKRRHQLPPLFLVAVKNGPSPHPKPAIPSHALNPAFAECVAARIVNISETAEEAFMTGRAPLWVSLKNLFLLRVSRKGGPMLEPEAEALAEKAFKNQATTSNDAVIKLADACRSHARQNDIKIFSRAALLKVFPPQFREAAEAS